MPECKRCGKCCHWVEGGKLKRCPHLVKLPNGKTLCRIYNHRLGTNIGDKRMCQMREKVHCNYEGCPFNKPEWGEIQIANPEIKEETKEEKIDGNHTNNVKSNI